MTTSQTAIKIKERIDNITETINGTTKDVVNQSWIGDIGAPPQVGQIVVTILAKTEEEEAFNYPGNSPPSSPQWVPWEIYITSAGMDVTDATLRLYTVVEMVKTALRSDMSFEGTCDEAVFDTPSVTYGVGGTDNNLAPTAIIKLRTYYSN